MSALLEIVRVLCLLVGVVGPFVLGSVCVDAWLALTGVKSQMAFGVGTAAPILLLCVGLILSDSEPCD